MERTLIKKSFMGFAHRVAPLQNVFHRECCDADLNTDVLEFFSGLQNELVGKMMDGACAISQHRRNTQWNLDPLLMSANYIKTCYRVRETTDKIDLSSSQEPLPRKRRTRCSSYLPKVHPASSKVKKNSAKKSKLKSKCNHTVNRNHK
ncbi:unnamed protein product [Larinioides sclopetarius]|uniref:Transcription initiation factor TFIID subunit 12 domain-containing protein n=1 Tax=Larinioides sclopetarius TaxID=280406 RepID=A0AAV1Z6E7_9ARAC